jgi:hypothetical protein
MAKKKWDVTGVVTGSKYLGTYEAETEQEAIEMALNSDRAGCSLCHQCTTECEDPEIESAVASETDE